MSRMWNVLRHGNDAMQERRNRVDAGGISAHVGGTLSPGRKVGARRNGKGVSGDGCVAEPPSGGEDDSGRIFRGPEGGREIPARVAGDGKPRASKRGDRV